MTDNRRILQFSTSESSDSTDDKILAPLFKTASATLFSFILSYVINLTIGGTELKKKYSEFLSDSYFLSTFCRYTTLSFSPPKRE